MFAWNHPRPHHVWVIVISLSMTLCLYSVWLVFGRQMAREVRKQRNQKGEQLCLECGYDLSSLSPDRCPECGHPARGDQS